MLKIGKDSCSNLDCDISLSQYQRITTLLSYIVDVLCSIRILHCQVLILEYEINFSHVKHLCWTFLRHDSSPGTNQIKWRKMVTGLITCLLNVSSVIFFASECLWITRITVWKWCAGFACLLFRRAVSGILITLKALWSLWISSITLIQLILVWIYAILAFR